MKTSKQFYEEQRLLGNTDNITCNPYPDYSLDFYKEIFNLMESYAQSHQVEMPSDEPYEPYFGWCDVDKCKNEGCCGGTGWRETGYWTLCTEHSAMARNGDKQPKMKKSSVKRENSRDKKTGYLIPTKAKSKIK